MKSMTSLILSFALLFGISSAGYAQDNSVFSAAEEREILSRLIELEFERQRTELLQKALNDAEAMRQREAELSAKELGLERARAAIAEERAQAERERGDALDAALKKALKKPGLGCRILKVLLLGQRSCI